MSTETTTPVDKEFFEYLRRLEEVATTLIEGKRSDEK